MPLRPLGPSPACECATVFAQPSPWRAASHYDDALIASRTAFAERWTDPNADAGHVKGMAMAVGRGPTSNTPFWSDDQLREAGVGFVDPKLRAAAAERVASSPRPE
jgi:hypothetical protein